MRTNFSTFQRKTPKFIKTKIMVDQKCLTTKAKANSLYTTTITTTKSKIHERNQEQSLMTCIIYPTTATTTIPTIDSKNGVIDQAKITIYQIEKPSISKLSPF